jgi:hypothetical protein
MRPPNIPLNRDQLEKSKDEVHELLVEIFGAYVMWCREQALENTRHLVESHEAREEIARLLREPFERAASEFSGEQKEIAHQLQSRAVANFGKLLLTLLSGTGFDQPLGRDFVARFRLVMEICDSREGNVISEEVLNRNGKKFFPEYWAKWLNEYPKQPNGRHG